MEYYSLIGFKFADGSENQDHVEPVTSEGSARLMIDTTELMTKVLGETPKPGNHSSFAIEFDAPDEVDEVCKKIAATGHTVIKKPWDAFWGQRYAVVKDPDGYMVDLYAYL